MDRITSRESDPTPWERQEYPGTRLGRVVDLFPTLNAAAAVGLQLDTEKKAAKCWKTLSDAAPRCPTWVQGEKDTSESELLLRAPFVMELLQTISSRAPG